MAEHETVVDMEVVRYQILLLGKAIKAYDDILAIVVEERWKYEMISRQPSLGRQAKGEVTAAGMIASMQAAEQELATAGEVVLFLMGDVPRSLDEAREVYLQLTVAFQQHSNLREVMAASDALVEGSFEALTKIVEPQDREGRLPLILRAERLRNEYEETIGNFQEVFAVPKFVK